MCARSWRLIVALSLAAALALAGCAQSDPSPTDAAAPAPDQGAPPPPADAGASAAAPAPGDPATRGAKTADALRQATQLAADLGARYAAYAPRADEEGYRQVAVLCRAAARSSAIHAAALGQLSDGPAAAAAPPVASTRDNVASVVKDASLARDGRYAEFVSAAEQEQQTAAVTALTHAQAAAGDVAALAQEALDQLENWQAVQRDFLVCPTCGHLTTRTDFSACPRCTTARGLFEAVR